MNKSLSLLQPSQFLLHYAAYLLPLSHFLALQICLLPLLHHFPCIPPSWVHLWVNPHLGSVISPCLMPSLSCLSSLSPFYHFSLKTNTSVSFLMPSYTWPTSHPSQNCFTCFKTLSGLVPRTLEKHQLYLKPEQKIDLFLFFIKFII